MPDIAFTVNDVTLRPWQAGALPNMLRAVKEHCGAVDASGLGTGKSYTAAFTAFHIAVKEGKMVVIITPLSVVPPWIRILLAMGLRRGRDFIVINYESARANKGIPGIGEWDPSRRRYIWNKDRVGLIVFDEAHKVRSQSPTLNSKLPIGAKAKNIPHLFVSATLAESPVHFRAMGFSLGLHKGSDFHAWARANGCTYDPWGKLKVKKTMEREVALRLNKLLFPEFGVRIRKEDIPGFPEEELLAEAFDFGVSGDIDKVYAEMEDELAELEDKVAADGRHVGKEAAVMVAMLRARQKVELLKVPGVAAMVEDLVEEGQSVAIFANFRPTVFALAEKLRRFMPSVIVGDQLPRERTAAIDAFQANLTPVAVVSVAAGGAGIGLHDIHGGHPRIGLIFPCYSSVDLRQACGRLPRDGALTKTTQKILFAANTVEEKVLARVQGKLLNLDLINDGDLAETPHAAPTPAEKARADAVDDEAEDAVGGFYA